MIGSTCSVGENWSTSMPCAVGSGSLATSAYGTSPPSTEQIRRNLIRPPSTRCTCRNVTSRCSVAAYSRMGIMTRPNEISPLHMARMMTQYPFCLVSRLLPFPGVRTVKTRQSKRSCHNEWDPWRPCWGAARENMGEGAVQRDTRRGSRMSESELEQPVPDLVEQRREVTEDPEEPMVTGVPSVPFDVNEADAMEQHREVELDEDDYR